MRYKYEEVTEEQIAIVERRWLAQELNNPQEPPKSLVEQIESLQQQVDELKAEINELKKSYTHS
jgi:peptidoglycan hydrolase CwlO-like protein